MTDEHRFSAPFDDDILALRNVGKLYLGLCESEDVGRCSHGLQEASNSGLGKGSGEDAEGADHEVRHGAVGGLIFRSVGGKIRHLRGVFCCNRCVDEALVEMGCGGRS